MDFTPTQDQQTIRRAVADLAAQFDDEYWLEKDSRHEFPHEFYDAFARDGWLGICVPEEHGGSGLGITEASIMLEEIAASGGGMNAASSLHGMIFGMHPVIKHGSPEMKARLLPKIVSGEMHVCFGVTEPDAGLDTTATKTFAKRNEAGTHYTCNGRKVWISKALHSEKVLLLTRTTKLEDCAKKTDGMSLFLTDVQSPNIEIRPIPKMGREAVDSNEVYIDDLQIPVEDLVGEEGQGFKYLLDGLNPERILIAAEALGLGRAALRRAVQYANERVVFGRPIGKNQGIQFPLADSRMRLDAAELVLRKASWKYDAGESAGLEANAAKYLCSEAGTEACDRAIQTHGGFGYAREYHVERYYKEARLLKLAPLPQEMVLNYVGEHVLGLPRSY
ncbi:acyl-CoA dehydrogenase family protein [Paraconexibacter algicola]|uniref:Acyl-CoA dehydrogenase n=1 Tax=Paraconexibacter algicola TaxID=2133960 RepID=A0A2T4UJR5_9ACTN|nr:acyl-CoA dehydrogenase family protein [Paraconexibacter algicola]PTL59504.1 acyl-CoA dehydrogenase [Paraconexibacter algicola]